MPGITLTIDDSEFEKTFGVIADNLADKKSAYRQAAAIARESVRYNFQVGGRPTKWEPSYGANDQGIGDSAGDTLRDTNRLMNSWTSGGSGAVTTKTASGIIVGTNVIYAGTMHYGAKKGSFGSFTFPVKSHTRKVKGKEQKVRAHLRTVKLPWGDIPARPFAMLQDEDVQDIREILAVHITQGA